MRVRAAVAAGVVLALMPWSASAFAPPGYSDPVTDSYYPAHESAGVDVYSYDLRLRWAPKSRTLKGTATLTVRPTATSTSIKLALSKRLAVSAVSVDGLPVDPTRDGNNLNIPGSFTQDVKSTVVITYSGSPRPVAAPTDRSDLRRLGWHTTADGRVWTMQEPFGAFTWYPVNDTPSDKAMYHVTVNVPDRWVGLFNGPLTSSSDANGRRTTEFAPAHPIASYLTTLAIGPYKKVTSTAKDGTPIVLWVPKSRPGDATMLDRTAGDFRWLTTQLGTYPFDQVGIVVVPSKSAMETPGLITLGRHQLTLGKQSLRQVVVHELSHAWFGDTTTPSDWSDLWLNEGFATYYQAKFAAARGWTTWRQEVRVWKLYDPGLRSSYGPPGAYFRDSFAELNVYWCSALMLNHLAGLVGRDQFPGLVQQWIADHHDTTVTRVDFTDWWNANSGQDVTTLVHDWLTSTTTP